MRHGPVRANAATKVAKMAAANVPAGKVVCEQGKQGVLGSPDACAGGTSETWTLILITNILLNLNLALDVDPSGF